MVLKMLVYAANSKGKSDPVIVEGFTLKVAEKQTGECYITSRYTESSIYDAANVIRKRLLIWVYRGIRWAYNGTAASYNENPVYPHRIRRAGNHLCIRSRPVLLTIDVTFNKTCRVEDRFIGQIFLHL
jgi:hypothetical protein